MIVIGKTNEKKELTIEDLKDGVSIMSIDARYIYGKQDEENGYDTSVHWKKDKDSLPRKLYSVKLPYSLGLIHWFGMENSKFKELENEVYANDIINVTFDSAFKVVATDKYGNVKYKPLIKTDKKGRYSFEVVEKMKTDKKINELRNEIYGSFILDGKKYVQFMRSPGKAREGAILFIKEEMLKDFLLWARMGIDFEQIKGQVDIAGLKAAESLILSEIKETITIKSNEILLIPDVKVPYKIPKGKASITEMGIDGMAVTNDNKEETEIVNDIFDGQSLLVSEYYHGGKSMLLLRNRFFKSAAFAFNIQRWFRDNGITEVSQLNGYTLAERVEDIKLITTPNSLKFMKQKKHLSFANNVEDLEFATYKYWLEHIEEDNCVFGVVKNEYASGFVKSYNYQVDNSLDLSKDDIRELLSYEYNRIQKAKNDNDYFIYEFLEKKKHKYIDDERFKKYKFDNCVCELYKINSDVQYTKFFRDYKNNMLGTDYKKLLKEGKYKLEDSDYCVVCSNPFEMIQHACNVKQSKWIRIHHGREAYCQYYSDKQDLIATRSPHIYSGNVVCLHNTYHKWFEDYMKLSDNIVVINSIESDIMDRCNSMDFDSDTVLLSSNPILVKQAKYCEENFPTPICRIEPTEKERYYRIEDFIDCDKVIANAKIGEIVDLSQLLQSYYHDVKKNPSIETDKKEKVLKYFRNEISKLASLSGCEIDRAKREFPVDTEKELNRIRDYIADYNNPDNLLNGIIKTGTVEFTIKTAKVEYLKDNPNISAEELEDYEIVKKVMNLNNKNNNLSEELDVALDEALIKKKQILENNKEISRLLKSRRRTKENVLAKPMFFKVVFSENDASYYEYFDCPMDYLQEIIKNEYPEKEKRDKITLEFMDFFQVPIEYNKKGNLKKGNDKHAKEIIKIAEEYENERKVLYANHSKANGLEYDAQKDKLKLFKNAVNKVSEITLTKQTIYLILNRLYGSNQAKSHDGGAREYRKTIMDILYNAHKNVLLQLFSKKVNFDDKAS